MSAEPTRDEMPKKPPNNYLLFLQREKKYSPEAGQTATREKWANISEKEKDFYNRLHAKKSLKYQRKMATYLEKYPEAFSSVLSKRKASRSRSPAPKKKQKTQREIKVKVENEVSHAEAGDILDLSDIEESSEESEDGIRIAI